jgi:PAS domain S-box-containing protein
MSKSDRTRQQLLDELQELTSRMMEAEETLRAIRGGEVDALVVSTAEGDQIFTLTGAEHPYRVMVETMNEGALTLASDGTILYCNQRFADIVKGSLENAIGSSIYQYISSTDLQLFKASVKRGIKKNSTVEIALQAGGENSVPVFFSISAIQHGDIPGAVCAVMVDITERKKMEEALKSSESRYRRLFETAQDGILIFEAETGQILDVNPFLAEMLGYSHENLLGKNLWEFGPIKDSEVSKATSSELKSKGHVRYEDLSLVTKDGRQITVEFVCNVYRVDHHDLIQCNIRDTTQRKHTEALKISHVELERVVEERTAELVAANRLMKKMLDEGKRKEERIRESRERLRRLLGRLQSMVEEEKMRISREIHDQLGQSLTALKLDLSRIRKRLISDGLAEPSANVHQIEQSVNRIIRTVRKISTELRPGILDELGVIAAIEWMAKDFQRRTGIGCKVTIRAVDTISDAILATAIFRIVQEAMTNVMRHAAASQVNVSLEKKDDTLIIEVRDNGIGIREGRIFGTKSLGLLGMRERVLLLGGETVISGKPGEGTLLRVTLPMGNGAGTNA